MMVMQRRWLPDLRENRIAAALGAKRELMFSLQGYGVASVASTSNASKSARESSNAAIIKRFNHHSAMVLAAGLRKQ